MLMESEMDSYIKSNINTDDRTKYLSFSSVLEVIEQSAGSSSIA